MEAPQDTEHTLLLFPGDEYVLGNKQLEKWHWYAAEGNDALNMKFISNGRVHFHFHTWSPIFFGSEAHALSQKLFNSISH